MTVGVLGKRYAVALLQLGIEANMVDRFARDVESFADTFKQSPELRAVFENPEFGAEVRKRIVNDIAIRMAMSTQVKNLLMLLSDRKRMRYLPEIADAYQILAEERSGKIRAEIVFAADLPETYFMELRRTLEGVTGKQVIIVKRKDPSLIGGVVTRIGDQVFDGSIRNRLDELKEELRSTTTTTVVGSTD